MHDAPHTLCPAAAAGKPWALLMPNYVANKQYFQDMACNVQGKG